MTRPRTMDDAMASRADTGEAVAFRIETATMNHPPLVSPWLDPTGIFELFRGNYATELLTAAVAHLRVFGVVPEMLRRSSLKGPRWMAPGCSWMWAEVRVSIRSPGSFATPR